MNKKAISDIVANILIILIGIMAVSILWISVESTIQKPFLSPQNNCFQENFNPPISIEKVCFNEITKDIELTIKLSTTNISELNFILDSSGKSKEWQCSNSCGDCTLPEPYSTKTYYFQNDNTNLKDKIFLIANSCLISKAEIKNNC